MIHLERLHVYRMRTSVVESAYKWAMDDAIPPHIYTQLHYAAIMFKSITSNNSVSTPNISQ